MSATLTVDPNPYTYRGTVTGIHDGDSITVRIDLGFRISYENAVRVYGIDAPELDTDAGRASLAYLQTLVQVGDMVTVRTFKPTLNAGGDKYGRWLATIRLADGTDVAGRMIAAGQAVAYFGGAR